MPRIVFSKESLEGPPQVTEGLYELRLEGFEPEFSKSRNNINLNPVLKIVNHATFNGSRVYDNLNSAASWINEAFVHAFGAKLIESPDGSADMPGIKNPDGSVTTFNGPDDDPTKWEYIGPLVGMVAKAYVKQTQYNGRPQTKIDQWFCAVPGCTQKHPSGLAK